MKIKTHPQYTHEDLEYLRGKGYTNREILAIWNRDLADGKAPVRRNKHKIDWAEEAQKIGRWS